MSFVCVDVQERETNTLKLLHWRILISPKSNLLSCKVVVIHGDVCLVTV